MSHELRTPLNGIIGFAEFLADGKPGAINAKQKEYLEDILNSGRHLLHLINDMLDLVKVQAGKLELHPETFSFRECVAEVCAGVAPLAASKRIALVVSIAPEIDTVTLDIQRFRQVLYNLLSNALKFTEESGEVEVRVEREGPHYFRLSVRDTGIGIGASDLGRLFIEFEQLDSGLSRRFGGTGLGLALTRSIVALQGGTVSVDSEVGKGSTFTVVLPRELGETAS
jgi:protein-histidine pros-kinase